MSAMTIFWLVATVIFGIIEAMTVALVTIWLAVGALAAGIAAALGAPVIVQIVIFVVVSGVLLFFTRPLAKKLSVKKHQPTNADRVVGATAMVVKEIDPINNEGQVKVLGQIWSARDVDNGDIEEGEYVEVLRIEGVRLMVRRKTAEK